MHACIHTNIHTRTYLTQSALRVLRFLRRRQHNYVYCVFCAQDKNNTLIMLPAPATVIVPNPCMTDGNLYGLVFKLNTQWHKRDSWQQFILSSFLRSRLTASQGHRQKPGLEGRAGVLWCGRDNLFAGLPRAPAEDRTGLA